MHRGYVKLWRKSLDAGWLRNHQLWAFWSWCLLKASHREFDAVVGLQIVRLQPGQFVFGRKKAAEETGLSEQQVRTIVAFLKKTKNLTIQITNRFSIISITNWHAYQGDESEINQQYNQPLTSSQPHTSTITHKENKRERRRKTPASLTPDNFLIDGKMREYARKKGYAGNLEAMTEKFLNHHRSKGSRFFDWGAAWRNWLIREIEFRLDHVQPAADAVPLNGGRTLDEVLS